MGDRRASVFGISNLVGFEPVKWELQWAQEAKIEWLMLESDDIRTGIERAFKGRLIDMDDPRTDSYVEALREDKHGYYRLQFRNYRAVFRLLVDNKQIYANERIPHGEKYAIQVVQVAYRGTVYGMKRSEYRRRLNG